ncbi:MAG: hypothetical protein WC506_03370 [Candidatus Micrarchaeia archaeon]
MFKPEIKPIAPGKALPVQGNGKPKQVKMGRNIVLFFENIKGPKMPGVASEELTEKDREMIAKGNLLLSKLEDKTPTGLKAADNAFYFRLYNRGLVPNLDCKRVRAPSLSWEHMNNDELVNYTRAYAKETGISWIWELKEKFNMLYDELLSRGITDQTGLRHNENAHVKRAVEIKEGSGITTAKELLHMDPAFYDLLQNRNLFEKAGLEVNSHIDWAGMDSVQIVNYVKKRMREEGSENLNQLTGSEQGWGLYIKVYRNGLTGFFKGKYKHVQEITEKDMSELAMQTEG